MKFKLLALPSVAQNIVGLLVWHGIKFSVSYPNVNDVQIESNNKKMFDIVDVNFLNSYTKLPCSVS